MAGTLDLWPANCLTCASESIRCRPVSAAGGDMGSNQPPRTPTDSQLSRRAFLRAAVLSSAALGLWACGPGTPAPPTAAPAPPKPTEEPAAPKPTTAPAAAATTAPAAAAKPAG